jgi:hypothetical protein
MTPVLEWHLDPSATALGPPDISDSQRENRVSKKGSNGGNAGSVMNAVYQFVP